jgi:nucleoid DNA-binding protein
MAKASKKKEVKKVDKTAKIRAGKNDLVSEILADERAAAAGFVSKRQTGEAINLLLDKITEMTADNKKIVLVGFGTFQTVSKQPRTFKTPQGQTVDVKGYDTLKFKASKMLKSEDK